VLLPFLLAGYKRGITLGSQQGNGAFSETQLFTQAVRLALAKRSYEHAAIAVNTTEEAIKDALTMGIQEGEGIAEGRPSLLHRSELLKERIACFVPPLMAEAQ